MSAEQARPEVEQIGHIELNGRGMDVFTEETQLPCDPEKRKICESHIAEGRASELFDEFWMMGCDFPKEGEDPTINIRFACEGLSRFRKHCRLTLTQYVAEGKELNKGKFTS